MAEYRLSRQLECVSLRMRKLDRLRYLSICWAVCGVAALVCWLVFGAAGELALASFGIGALMAVLICIVTPKRSPDFDKAAHLIEEQHPDLDARLLTAVEQKPNAETGSFSYLQTSVVTDALRHSAVNDWTTVVPGWKMALAGGVMVASLCFFMGTIALLTLQDNPQALIAYPKPAPFTSHGLSNAITLSVDPGDVEIERGSSLLVLATFPGQLPAEASIVTVPVAASWDNQSLPLHKSLDDPVFGGRIPNVAEDLQYCVVYDGKQSPYYIIKTFEFPELKQADATVKHPEYTKLADKTIKDVRRLTVAEGSQVTLNCDLNKPVERARLVKADGSAVEMKPRADNPARLVATLDAKDKETYRLELTDDAGRTAKEPAQFVLDVQKNNVPELAIKHPAKDIRVSPLQELTMRAEVWDDFGLKEVGLIYEKPDGGSEKLVLADANKVAESTEPNQKQTLGHLLALEDLDVEPNQLIAYHFYADDIGPDGQTRRTESDLYFAEVRHFDEIYRQVASQPGQAGQGGNECKKLLEMQKQVINGAWKLVRTEPLNPPSKSFTDDADTLAVSQTHIRELVEKFAAKINDVLLKQYAQEVVEHMSDAAQQFSTAHEQTTIDPLPEGRSSAQSAYQALLKLQSREHKVKHSQSKGSGKPSKQKKTRENEQLKQLELKNDRCRYETAQQAKQQQQQNREELQALNRLRELAQRQADLNKRLKELENALRLAKDEKEKEQIERQLARLREQQQEQLRDIEELAERMSRPDNQRKMADARQQLEQTREQVRKASEALKENQVSKALTAGTRAERELEKMRDDFRQRTAGQFADAMRQMQDDAQQLSEKQQQIAEQMNPTGKQQSDNNTKQPGEARSRPSLKSSGEKTSVSDQLAQQEEQLRKLLDQMRETVQQAETSEPLLSKQLYDALRETREEKPTEALKMASTLAKRGLPRDAQQMEQIARKGIDGLKQKIDKAAAGILGNDQEALQRAQQELAALAKSLEREIAAASPEQQQKFAKMNPQAGSQAQGKAQGSQPLGLGKQNGQGKQSHGKQGEGKPGEGKQGQGKQGQGKPGQGQSGQGQSGQGQSGQGQAAQGQQPGEQGQGGQGGQSQGGKSTPRQRPSLADANRPGQQSSSQQSSSQQPSSQQPSSQQSSSSQQGGTNSGGTSSGGTSSGGSTAADDIRPSLADIAQALAPPGIKEGGGGNPAGLLTPRPLGTPNFMQWSDRMRDVEEMISDPDLRTKVASLRERARQMRIDIKEGQRHSHEPNWDLVRTSIYGPMLELEQQVAEELARLDPGERLVRIDRDPVPSEFAELVRKYYQELGSAE